MFESIELRKVQNGIIILIRDEENDEKSTSTTLIARH